MLNTSTSKMHVIPSFLKCPSISIGSSLAAHFGRQYHRQTPATLPHSTQRRFSDFLVPDDDSSPSSNKAAPTTVTPEEKAQDLIERMSSLLGDAQSALDTVRQREPSDSRHRRVGPEITSKTEQSVTSGSTRYPRANPVSFLQWSDDEEEEESTADGTTLGSSSNSTFSPSKYENNSYYNNSSRVHDTLDNGDDSDYSTGGMSSRSTNGGGAGDFSNFSGGDQTPGGVDAWFGGKVDTGPLLLKSSSLKPSGGGGVAVMDRDPDIPSILEFGAPEAPAESAAATIFPESLALRFQSQVQQEEQEEAAATAAESPQPEGLYERTSGEEFGPDGYWYRWTKISGKDASGKVQWFEHWWEASDWAGMREMGAEKWGANAQGDAWRETWRESIGFDAAAAQPTIERTAHKWARNARGGEWEEKWGESYWSGGKADKWADKWGREGGDVWHEKWGEQYDGQGGCFKFTDRWAERPTDGGLLKWGDKWEEGFGHGSGSKKGETWSEGPGGQRYNRWWGENHFGDGSVQKYGHSTEGEHWDTTEYMDTYYNPIPHFGYDLALSHSPQLRNVPTMPRDTLLETEEEDESAGGGDGEGKRGGKGKGRGRGKGGKGGKAGGLSGLFD